MRKGVAVVALLAAAVCVAAGYLGAKHIGEGRLRATMEHVVAGFGPAAKVRYGKITFDPLSGRGTINDIAVSWYQSETTIGEVVIDPRGSDGGSKSSHGRVAFQRVVDRGSGLLHALLAWSFGLSLSDGENGQIGYDIGLDFTYRPDARALVIGAMTLTAPDWGDLKISLDLTDVPGTLAWPQLREIPVLEGPALVLTELIKQQPDLAAIRIRSGTVSYQDHGAVNKVLAATARLYPVGDEKFRYVYWLDRLPESTAARPLDGTARALMTGTADVEASVAPQAPARADAAFHALQGKDAETLATLGLKIATSGSRPLGPFAMTDAEMRSARVWYELGAGEDYLSAGDRANTLQALRVFQWALKIAPEDARANAGVREVVRRLLDEGIRAEAKGIFTGPDGALVVYRDVLIRVPGSVEAQAAVEAMPRHMAAAAVSAASNGTAAGADDAVALLHDAASLAPQDPAVLAAIRAVGDRLMRAGDELASTGAYLTEDGNAGALDYYRAAWELQPNDAATLQPLDALAERLQESIAQQIAAGDKPGATARIEAVKAQWPEFAGRAKLAARLEALLAPPMSQTVAVYNWSDYIGEFTNARFQQKTGIAVQYDVFDSNETLEAKLIAGNSGYDVVVPIGGFMARQIPAGLFRKLDKSKLPNLANLDPAIMKASEAFDPGHEYSVPYMWGTVGIGYNVAAVKKRMPDAPVDSWRLVFDPKVVAKFKDCGVAIVDAPSDVLLAVLVYLGRDVNTASPGDYAAAQRTLAAIRPFVRYIHSSSYINDIANGEICLAIGWNGDFAIAQSRADQARNRIKLRYVVPKEGTLIWMDSLAIPADAPHPDAALAYIDYLLDPQVAANNANYVRYASPNKAAIVRGLINAADLNNPAIYPPRPVMERLASDKLASPEVDRLRTQAWAAVKSSK